MNENSKTYRITGTDALRLAERDQLTLHCYSNPLCGGGDVSVEIGRQIAKDDANLLWVNVMPRGWMTRSGARSNMDGYSVCQYFNSQGMYFGPDDDGVEPIWNDADRD